MKHDRIPPELVKILHSKTMQLAARGLGPARIARKLSAAHSLNVTPETIRHWLVGDRNPLFRNTFKLEPSAALSYIIGANLGDGCTLEKNWCVKLEVADLGFAETYNNYMAKLFSRPRPNRILVRRFNAERLPIYIVKYSSKQLAKLLLLPLNKLLKLAFVFPREFLRGFFDAEGHVGVGVSKYLVLFVGAENSNKPLLLRIMRLLKLALGIESLVHRKRREGSVKIIRGNAFTMKQSSYSLIIGRIDDVKKFAASVGFSIHRKIQKLKDALWIFDIAPPEDRPIIWKQLYCKDRGEWLRREAMPSQSKGY